jgi:hypothetical protein
LSRSIHLAIAEFGYSVASAGDVNGDGYADVIIGAPLYANGQSQEGRAYVYHGSSTGLPVNGNWSAESDQATAWFGYSVASAGDVNGDGYSDVVVGSPFYDNGQTDEGRGYVYHGSSTGLNASSSWNAESDQASAEFGFSVASAGDVNGDGYADVVVGAPFYDSLFTNEGRAYAFYGGSTGVATSPTWTRANNISGGAQFGTSVASAGDINGDGYADILVGAPLFTNGETGEGRVYSYYGSASGMPRDGNWSAESNQANAEMGRSVASAGDVNGDGYSDVIAGARYYDNGQTDEGRAFVFYGSTATLATGTSTSWTDSQVGSEYAYNLAGAGDVNGDGYSDVIVAARFYDNGQNDEGRVFVYHGSASGPSASPDWSTENNQADSYFGESVASAGDVNGDGYGDVVIGADFYDNGQTNEGKVYVYHGSSIGLGGSPAWTYESNQAFARIGYSSACAGDVNRDGYSDVIVGAPFYSNGQTDEGRAFVFLGSSTGLAGSPNWTAESDQASTQYGWSVAGAGDVNGDGYSDVIVGANYYDNGQTDEGRAYVYHGSATGPNTSANWTTESNQASSEYGVCVASAGDVNGDGYSDVIVGANHYDNGQTDEGRAYVYHGTSTGLHTTADWTAESNQADAYFGVSVASAGDVNGDGYSDVIVGANYYDNGQTDEGRAYAYHGTSTGLHTTADWTAESDKGTANYGRCVAGLGDVNGDGYSDVAVGAPWWEAVVGGYGRAFVYYGNSEVYSTVNGKAASAQQFRGDFSRPVVPPLAVNSTSQAGLQLDGRGPAGRGDVKVQFEVKALGTAFNGSSLVETSFWSDGGLSGSMIGQTITGLSSSTNYKWRARRRYRLSEGRVQVFSPWYYPPYNGGRGESDFRTIVYPPKMILPETGPAAIPAPEGLAVSARPNPASGPIRLIMGDLKPGTSATVVVYNSAGEQVHELTGAVSDEGIELSGLRPGAYLCQVRADHRVGVVKVVVR